MADDSDKSCDREETQLRVDFLELVECYQIIAEVFFDYIPDDKKVLAMSQAVERIKYEVKDSERVD